MSKEQENKDNELREESLKIHATIIQTMELMGFGLLLDGKTFYQRGYEIAPRENTTFTMNQAYIIHQREQQLKSELLKRVGQERIKHLGEDGYIQDILKRRQHAIPAFNDGFRTGYNTALSEISTIINNIFKHE